MKYNLHFTLRGPSGRVVEAPNEANPVEAADMDALLHQLEGHLPEARDAGIVCVGVKILDADLNEDDVEVS